MMYNKIRDRSACLGPGVQICHIFCRMDSGPWHTHSWPITLSPVTPVPLSILLCSNWVGGVKC